MLFDLNMPGVEGCEFLRMFRQREKLVPVLVLSTSSHPDDIEGCYHAGANAYLVKPFELEDWQTMMATTANFWLNIAQLPIRGTTQARDVIR